MPLPSGFSQERVSMKTPTTLIIMDGFGLGPKYPGNAVENTPKPHLENIFKECPGCRLSASGLDVGLPEGQMGNSEVGHTNIGAGRVVFQDLPRISRDIDRRGVLQESCLFGGHGALPGMGHRPAPDGPAVRRRRPQPHHPPVRPAEDGQGAGAGEGVCPLLPGWPRRAPHLRQGLCGRSCQAKLEELGVGRIATVMGRYYAMDRDKRWDRVQQAYDAIVLRRGRSLRRTPPPLVQKSYDAGRHRRVHGARWSAPKGAQVRDNDSIIFYNFRPDRAREITRCLCG